MGKSFNISVLLALLVVMPLFAGNIRFKVYQKSDTRSVNSDINIEKVVSKALNLEKKDYLYYKSGVNVYSDTSGQIDYLVVYMLKRGVYGADAFRLEPVTADSFFVIENYIEEDEDDNPICRGCPDESVEVIVSTPMKDDKDFPLAESNVRKANTFLNSIGVKTVMLLGENETDASTIKQWLSCKNLKMWARIGHGLSGSIIVGNNTSITSSYVASLNGGLHNKVMLWNSCIVHSSPMISSLVTSTSGADAYWFAAGDNVNLMAGPSEPTWEAWIERVVGDGDEMNTTMGIVNDEFNNPASNSWGCTGNPRQGSEWYWNKISTPTLEVSTPNGGEIFTISTSTDITWSTNANGNATISLIKNDSVEKVLSSSATGGSYSWNIAANIVPGKYKILIELDTLEDESDAVFTIKGKPSITVNSEEIKMTLDTQNTLTDDYILNIENSGEGELAYKIKSKNKNSSGGILINEIFTPYNEFFDGIELWNKGADMDMTGWSIAWSDNNSTSGTFDFKDGFIFKAGKTLILTDDKNSVNSSSFYIGVNLGWSNTGGTDGNKTELSISIYDADNNGVDFVRSAGNSDTPPAGTEWNGAGIDISDASQRLFRNSNNDNDNASDWSIGTGESSVNQINPGQTLINDKEWIAISPEESTILASSTENIKISFNSSLLEIGTYYDTLIITHDDPDKVSPIYVPVKLIVDAKTAMLTINKNGIKNFSLKILGSTIIYAIPELNANQKVTIKLYDLRGKIVSIITSGVKKSGYYRVSINSNNINLASGRYICIMKAKGFSKAVNMTFLK